MKKPKLGKWMEIETPLEVYFGNGIALSISTRYDGDGNSIVRFILKNIGEETQFEKYNSAIVAYNMACNKYDAIIRPRAGR